MNTMEEDIIALGTIILAAMSGGEGALTLLFEHSWMKKLLDEVSAWAGWKYNQDKEDLRQILAVTLLEKIHTLNHPQPSALRSWCYSTLSHYCLNEKRRGKSTKKYDDEINNMIRCGKRKSSEGSSVVESSTVLTPEHNFLMDEGLRRATESFPQEIVDGWALGKTANEIAEETGKSVKTIYPILRKIQQAIIKETGLAPAGKKSYGKTSPGLTEG